MKVIAFEGLFSYSAGYVRNGLLEKLGVPYEDHSWFWGRPKIQSKVLVIGHSFGSTPAIAYAEKCGLSAKLLLLDPRRAWTGGGGQVAPTGIETINFFRTGPMTGYPVRGAFGHQLPSSVGHTAVPFHPEVLACAKSMLKRLEG